LRQEAKKVTTSYLPKEFELEGPRQKNIRKRMRQGKRKKQQAITLKNMNQSDDQCVSKL
jgi:hypothetical protein